MIGLTHILYWCSGYRQVWQIGLNWSDKPAAAQALHSMQSTALYTHVLALMTINKGMHVKSHVIIKETVSTGFTR